MMSPRSFFAFLLVALGIETTLLAQQDAQSTFYFFNPLQFNAANAGQRGTLHAVAGNRLQWIGWDGAPRTQYVAVDAPVFRNRLGLGTNWINDRTGNRSFLTGNAHVAYHLPTGIHDITLSFGLNGGFQNNRADFQGLRIDDPLDPAYTQAYRASSWNFGSGVLATRDGAYIGLSMPHMIRQELAGGVLRRHVFITGGYRHEVSNTLVLEPSVLFKMTSGAPAALDLNLRARVFDAIGAGVLYRMNESLGFFAAYRLDPNLDIGYAFDFPVNGARMGNFGHHELALVLDIRGRRAAYTNPRLF